MTDDTRENGTSEESEWSDDGRSALERLRLTSREPSRLLRVRTLAVLHDRGLVMPNGSTRPAVHRSASPRFGRLFAIAAGVALVFVAGGAVGYRLALSRAVARSGDGPVRVAAKSTAPFVAVTQRTVERHVVWF
jgi:hypothetical protein